MSDRCKRKIMSFRKLKDADLIKFIRSFKEKECLWNKRSLNYNNVMFKIKSYNQLSKEFDMNGIDVKRLINYLQTNFIREREMAMVAKKYDFQVSYKPQIKWYNEMLFLVEVLQTDSKNNSVDNEHDYVEYLQEEEVYTVPNRPSEEAMEYSVLGSAETTKITLHQPISLSSDADNAKSPTDDTHINESSHDMAHSEINDEIEQFCKSLAAQMVGLPVRSMIQLQMEIQNLISNKRLEELKTSSYILNQLQ